MKIRTMICAMSIALLAFGLASCGNRKAELEAQRIVDSLAEELMLAEAHAQWVEDSLAKVNFTTYDLSFCEVHGPVKSIVYSGDGNRFEFSEDGQLVRLNGYNPFSADSYSDPSGSKISYIRDSQGRIAEESGLESGCTYTWDGQRLTGYEWGAESYYGITLYAYDNRGFISESKHVEGSYGDGESNNGSFTYQYISIDDYGNWTVRKEGGSTTRRTITYYPITR